MAFKEKSSIKLTEQGEALVSRIKQCREALEDENEAGVPKYIASNFLSEGDNWFGRFRTEIEGRADEEMDSASIDEAIPNATLTDLIISEDEDDTDLDDDIWDDEDDDEEDFSDEEYDD